ncbi:DNA phosphorothioation-dependent restriction protein DptG [Catenuloplanes sp. NPDC051500]|uniref:DNA phosphorothioation-dependent restriction protein DptG n=1 Tax=Catenuloplanes sp. NPDC051500 TaxID=3363959 RepID=UPI00379231D0
MSSASTALEALARQLPGAQAGVTLVGDEILVDGQPCINVPGKRSDWMRHEAPTVWPNTPHGEPRETLLYGIVKDAADYQGVKPLDGTLRAALEQDLPGESGEQRQALAAAMTAKFWTTAAGRPRAGGQVRRYLMPLHSRLPIAFQQEKAEGGKTAFGYKMFRGTVLPFLLSDPAGGTDEALLDRFLKVFVKDTDLTRLDREVLEIAARLAPDTPGPDVGTLLSKSGKVLRRIAEEGGALCQPSLARFRNDLDQVLGLDLPRRDLINQLTVLLALHLSVRLYRSGMVLSAQLDRCISLFPGGETADSESSACAAGCAGDLLRCDAAGRMQFRTGSGSYRPVKLSDPCVSSYREMTSRYLLPLPVTITCVNFIIDATRAAGGVEIPSMDLTALYAALIDNSRLRAQIDGVARLLAICHLYQLRDAAVPELHSLDQPQLPGLYLLRAALLEGRRSTMRRESRDVVNQLVKEVRNGRMIASNGPAATFFELDEDMLYLLVRLVCHGELVPFSRFIKGLAAYGLAPQSSAEEQLLQQALERLGMLQRYSDASESAYVHHTETDIAGGETS